MMAETVESGKMWKQWYHTTNILCGTAVATPKYTDSGKLSWQSSATLIMDF
jgi:hypothetical protein